MPIASRSRGCRQHLASMGDMNHSGTASWLLLTASTAAMLITGCASKGADSAPSAETAKPQHRIVQGGKGGISYDTWDSDNHHVVPEGHPSADLHLDESSCRVENGTAHAKIIVTNHTSSTNDYAAAVDFYNSETAALGEEYATATVAVYAVTPNESVELDATGPVTKTASANLCGLSFSQRYTS